MKKEKIPLYFTLARIYLVPVILFFMIFPTTKPTESTTNIQMFDLLATFFFIIASMTDYFDGYYARKLNAVSNFGKFMDPIADKILVSSILVALIFLKRIDPYMVIIIMARDTFIGGIRSVAAAENLIIDAKPAGKWKTAMQMVAMPLLILGNSFFQSYSPILIGQIVMWVSTVLSVTSGWEYYQAYQESQNKKR